MSLSIRSVFVKNKAIIAVIMALTGFFASEAIKHGDMFYIKDKASGKYVTTEDALGITEQYLAGRSPKLDSTRWIYPECCFLGRLKFSDKPDGSSVWMARSLTGALGVELGVGEETPVYMQNMASGGLLMFVTHHAFWGIGDQALEYFDYLEAGISRHSIKSHQICFLESKGENEFVLRTPVWPVPHRRRNTKKLPFGRDTELNEKFKAVGQDMILVAENLRSSPAAKKSKDTIVKSLTARGFKKIDNCRGFRVFCHVDKNGDESVYFLRSVKPGDGTNGELYRIRNDYKTVDHYQDSAPNIELRAPMGISDIDINENGEILATAGATYPAHYATTKSHIDNLHTGRFDFNKRWTFLPQNNIYAYIQGGRPWHGMKHDGSLVPVDPVFNNGWTSIPYHIEALAKGYYPIEDKDLPYERSVTNDEGDTFTIRLTKDRKIWHGKNGEIKEMIPNTVQKIGGSGWVDDKTLYVDLENDHQFGYKHNGRYPITVGWAWAVGENIKVGSMYYPDWKLWNPVTFKLPPSIEFRQRYLKHGENGTLFAAKLSQKYDDQSLLMHDGNKWSFLPTPTKPIWIETDSAGAYWYLDNASKFYTYSGGVGGTWNEVAINTSAMGEPVRRFSLAGSGDNLKLAVVTATGLVGVGQGPKSGITVKNLNQADTPIWGAFDASVGSDGTLAIAIRDKDKDEDGQVWVGSINRASSDVFVQAELSAG